MKQRLFFGMEAICPWPDELPFGRILKEKDRHLTLAFLGQQDPLLLQSQLANFPEPDFSIGLAGCFDQMLFLPEKSPRTASWGVSLYERQTQLTSFRKRLFSWLGLPFEGHFLPHVTVARQPEDRGLWSRSFSQLPLYLGNIHLYRSLGQLNYESLWSFSLLPPFEELEHTADIAFLIRGEDWKSLYLHAFLALAFEFPPLLHMFRPQAPQDFAALIFALNDLVSKTDAKYGCPFKAVSLHGEIKVQNRVWEWEMIVDV